MNRSQKILITGGAGFIGSNAAARFLKLGQQVTICDNLSRKGAEKNLEWLRSQFGAHSFEFHPVDVRAAEALLPIVKNQDVIIHLAGQVAVTSSVVNPRDDFENNAFGTLNVLEAARLSGNHPIVLYASTNKVYGEMEAARVIQKENRYAYQNFPFGISEDYPLDFHSPYGCSKGAADQYTRDYARIYDLPTVVFRQSCIYGPRQMGIEDQGWIAWFSIAVLTHKNITIYGDGKQVRDILFIDDLIDAYQAAIENIDRCSGQVYNIGGGPDHTIAIWSELRPILENLAGHAIPTVYAGWRPGDQHIYISDIRKIQRDLGWTPRIKVDEGVQRLWDWVKQNRALF